MGEGFRTHVAARHPERAGDMGEDRGVQTGVRKGDEIRLFQEIGGERRAGDHVEAGGQHRDAGKVRNACLHHGKARLKRHQRDVLREDEEEDARVFRRRTLR